MDRTRPTLYEQFITETPTLDFTSASPGREVSIEDIARGALPLVGSVAGSLAGGLLTRHPTGVAEGAAFGRRLGMALSPKQLAASAGGAGIGGVLGEQAAEGITTGSLLPPDDMLQLGLKYAATDAVGNAIFRLGAEVIKIPLSKLGSHFGAATETEKIRQAQQFLTKDGGTLTGWQAGQGGPLSAIEGILRGTPTASGIFEQQAANTVKALESGRARMLSRASESEFNAEQTGVALKNLADTGANDLYAIVEPFYKQIDSFKVGVDISPVIKNAQNKLDALSAMTKSGKPSPLATSTGVITELQNVTDLVPNQSFSAIHNTLSGLKSKIRDTSAEFGPNSQQVRVLKDTVKQLEDAMDTTAQKVFGGAKGNMFEQYKNVSTFYRENINNLYTDGLAAAMKKNADQVGQVIFSNSTAMNAKDIITSINTVKKLSSNPAESEAMLDNLRRGFLEKMLGSGELTEVGLRKSISSWESNKVNKEIANALLRPSQYHGVKAFMNAAEHAGKSPSNRFSLFATSRQFSAGQQLATILGGAGVAMGGTYLYSGGLPEALTSAAAAGAVLMTPRILAKVAVNPSHVNRLLNLEGKLNKAGLTGSTVAQLSQVLADAGVAPEDILLVPSQQQPESQLYNQFIQ